MPVVETNGTNLEYIEKGHGDPIIFVHGSLGDLGTWRFQTEYFSKFYRAIAYSRRYHYPNAGPGEILDYSVDLHTKDLASLIEGLGLQRPHSGLVFWGLCRLSPHCRTSGTSEIFNPRRASTPPLVGGYPRGYAPHGSIFNESMGTDEKRFP